MSHQCRSKVELIQLGSAHEKYGVWTRPKVFIRHRRSENSPLTTQNSPANVRSQSLGHYIFWRGKKSVWMAEIQEVFWETHLKILELLIIFISRQKSVYVLKKFVSYTLLYSKNLIFFTMNRRFIFSTIWSSITHAILKKKRKTLKKRDKITSSWILQIKRFIFQHGDIEVKISHILLFIKRFHI